MDDDISKLDIFTHRIDSYLLEVLQGKLEGMLSDFLCDPYLKSGQLVRLYPEVEIQLFLYCLYETVTPPR